MSEKISDSAILNATGKDRAYWHAFLGQRPQADHQTQVGRLKEQGVSPWWAQTLAVEFEKAQGQRRTGQTQDVGWQLGLQKTLPWGAQALWARLLEPDMLALWLGALPALPEAKGETFTTGEGIQGEIRTYAPGKRLRLKLKDPRLEGPRRLQLTLVEKSGKTALRVHWELLASETEREALRRAWEELLERLARSL